VTCCTGAIAATLEACGRATVPETSIGRTSETLNTATPVRAMTDAPFGEKSERAALSDRKIHSSRPATTRGRLAV
jgi:hypothetical protein